MCALDCLYLCLSLVMEAGSPPDSKLILKATAFGHDAWMDGMCADVGHSAVIGWCWDATILNRGTAASIEWTASHRTTHVGGAFDFSKVKIQWYLFHLTTPIALGFTCCCIDAWKTRGNYCIGAQTNSSTFYLFKCAAKGVWHDVLVVKQKWNPKHKFTDLLMSWASLRRKKSFKSIFKTMVCCVTSMFGRAFLTRNESR